MSFPQFLKLPKEIRALILCECDYTTLKQYSKTSKTIREELFDNGLFWRIKTEKDFGCLSSGNLEANIWKVAYMRFFDESKVEFLNYIWDRKENVVRNVLRAGIYPETRSSRGHIPLIEASVRNSPKIVDALVSSGANINVSDEEGATALMWASFYEHLEVVRVLLERGADPNLRSWDEQTALIIASREGHFEVVKELLTYKADPNIKECNGMTALLLSIEQGHEKIATILIKHGAVP